MSSEERKQFRLYGLLSDHPLLLILIVVSTLFHLSHVVYLIDLRSQIPDLYLYFKVDFSMLFSAAESTSPLGTCFLVECKDCGKTTWQVSMVIIFEIGCYFFQWDPFERDCHFHLMEKNSAK